MNKQSKQRINEFYHQWQRKQYPNNPYLMDYQHKDNSANGLTRCIIDFLKYNGMQGERINNTGRYVNDKTKFVDSVGYNREIGSGKYIKGTGTNGTADISATIPCLIKGVLIGMSVKFEVKYGKDRQSEAQKEYEDNILQSGGHYFIIRTFDEFLEIFDNLIKPIS